MSAYVVSHEHLDALVAFGLSAMPRNHGPMRWTDEPISREDGWDYGMEEWLRLMKWCGSAVTYSGPEAVTLARDAFLCECRSCFWLDVV